MSDIIINEVVNSTTGETYLDLTEDTVSESNLLLNQTAHNSEGEAIVGAMQAGGTSDYSALTNKPQINSVELTGNKTSSQLGLVSTSDLSNYYTSSQTDTLLNAKADSDDVYTKTATDTLLSAKQNVILTSTLSIGGQSETTVEGALGALNTVKADSEDVYTKNATDTLLNAKQNVILSSALSIGGQTETTVEGALDALNTSKQGTLTAGEGITISASNVISSTGGSGGGGDMLKSVYDNENAVATAGGIPDYVSSAISGKANTADLATVATSGSYADLSNKPTIPTVDQVYDATSANAQSGVAVASAISGKADSADVYTKSATDTLLNAKQDTLTAGTNITIENNVISATGGGGSVTGNTADCTVSFTSSDDDTTTDTTTAGMTSVSTLTSGETHASLFQKISKMFLNIRKLWNMIGSTDISSVGTTLTGAISSLNSNTIYSTTEKVVGTWIDSKPIYEVTIVKTSNLSNAYTIASDIDSLISVTGICSGSNNVYNFQYIPFADNISLYYQYCLTGYFSKTDNLWHPQIGSTILGLINKTTMTFRYTKTTD